MIWLHRIGQAIGLICMAVSLFAEIGIYFMIYSATFFLYSTIMVVYYETEERD